MVQFLSINFFSWIFSIFVGFFKSSRFFVSPCISTCFAQFSQQTAITSPYNIKWLVIITEMECVYCQSCHIQAVCHQTLKTEAQLQSHASPCKTHGEKNWNYDIIYKVTCYQIQWCMANSGISLGCDHHRVDCFKLQSIFLQQASHRHASHAI